MHEPSLRDERRILYAEFVAIDDSAASRIEVLLGVLTAAVRAEAGNIAFDAYRKSKDPREFFVYEVYVDEAAFRSHLGQEHGRVFNAQLVNLVSGGASELTWLTPLATSGRATSL